MEPRFGTDFGDVRVHTGSAARNVSRALQAEAFTYGSDIYYGVQQRGAAGQMAARRMQRSFAASYSVTLGVFEVDLQTLEIDKVTGASGADVAARTIPAAQAPRGRLGEPGVRTQDDPDRGIEGGFATDVHLARPETRQARPRACRAGS